MPKYVVRIQKVNDGIECKLKKGRAGENSGRACASAYYWWRRQVMAINEVNEEWFRFKETNNRVSDRKCYFNGLEPWGFVVDGLMQNTGSMPTGHRAKILYFYQSALTHHLLFGDDERKSHAWWTDVEVRVDRIVGESFYRTVAIRPLRCDGLHCAAHVGDNPVGIEESGHGL